MGPLPRNFPGRGPRAWFLQADLPDKAVILAEKRWPLAAVRRVDGRVIESQCVQK